MLTLLTVHLELYLMHLFLWRETQLRQESLDLLVRVSRECHLLDSVERNLLRLRHSQQEVLQGELWVLIVPVKRWQHSLNLYLNELVQKN